MSLKSKIIGLGVAAALVFGAAGAAHAAAAYADSPLNVRARPSTSAAIVDVLQRGERVNVEFCRGSWCHVTKPGPDGWVSARYLSRGGYHDHHHYFDDDDYYYDEDVIIIERPRRYPRYRYYDPGFSACIGGPNASFCISD